MREYTKNRLEYNKTEQVRTEQHTLEKIRIEPNRR